MADENMNTIHITEKQKSKLLISIIAAVAEMERENIRVQSAAYTDDDGVNVTPDDGTVYFLTSVSNQNLLNFVDGNEQTLPQNSIAANNSIDDETVTPEMDESTEETTEEEPEPVEKKEKQTRTMMSYTARARKKRTSRNH